MENIVVELSRYNTVDTNGNSEWTNHLSKNIKIEANDSIVVKQCFIDTRLIDNTSILIDQDVEWTFYYVYWVTNHGVNMKLSDGPLNDTINPITPDGLPYLLCTMKNPTTPTPNADYSNVNTIPLVDKFTAKIKKGTYERSYLAAYITKQFEGVQEPENTILADLRWGNTQGFPVFKNKTAGSYPVTFTDYDNIEGDNKIVTPFLKPLLLANLNAPITPPINTGFLNAYMDTQGLWQPAVFNNFLNNINGSYLYGDKSLVTSIDTVDEAHYLGTFNFGISYPFKAYEGGYVGTSQLALVYNEENNNKFSFSYAHTPLVNNGNEVVGTFLKQQNTPTNFKDKTLSFFNSYSGILFVETYTNLTPTDSDGNYLYDEDPFFSQLGMLYNDIVSPDSKNLFEYVQTQSNTQIIKTGSMSQSNFLSHTTKNFFSMSSLTDSSDTSTDVSGYKIQNPRTFYSKIGYNFIQSNITDEMFFSNVPVSSTTNAGHYLVDIQAYDNTYVNDNELYSIKATVSNFYLSGDSFTSTLGQDSYIYTHQGVPMSLSSIKVRILNPVTKENSSNVGGNSTIYLQVYKAQQKLQVEPEKKQDEKKEQNN